MSKKQVYVHQIQAPADKNLLPLAAGVITSYAAQIPELATNYDFDIRILREAPSVTVSSYIDPDVLAFSTYSWNFRQSLEIARLAKIEKPDVLTVFGGPMIALTQRSYELEVFFKDYSFVDIVVHGMGEWVFAEILSARLGDPQWDHIAGISYRAPYAEHGYVSTAPAEFNRNLDELPSPFLDGTFDRLLAEYGSAITGALWETNRGCPFHCSFCVQGDRAFDRVLEFDQDRLFKELKWMSQKKIEYVFATDANFGMKRRDHEIAQELANLKVQYGYPSYFTVNWTKNSSAKIFRTADALREGGFDTRMTLSRQSFDENTLQAVGRKNIKLSTYDEMKSLAAKTEVAAYTELILGLPGDTYDAFVNGLDQAMDHHLTHNFVVYLCRLLNGTEMTTLKERQLHQYEIRTCKVGFGRRIAVDKGVDEYEEIVVGTSTMSVDEWRKSHTFANLTMALYNTRLTFYVLNYLKQEHKINLRDYFENLMSDEWISEHCPLIDSAMGAISDCQESILSEDTCLVRLDFTGDMLLEPHEAANFILLNEKNQFYTELKNWTIHYLESRGIVFDQGLLDEIFQYQKSLIPTWKDKLDSSVEYEYNVPQYFNELCRNDELISLRKLRTNVELTDDVAETNDPILFSKQRLGGVGTMKVGRIKSISSVESTQEDGSLDMKSIHDNLEVV